MKRIIFFVLAFFCSASLASLSGQLKSSTDIYSQDLGEPTDTLVPYVNLDLSGKGKLTKAWRVQWNGMGLVNTESAHAPEKLYGDLREAFVQYKKKSVDFRLGMDTVNWGVVDVMSPMDVVNTSAFFHPLRTYRRGAAMVEAKIEKESWGLHALYIPRQRRPLMPSSDSRWLPRKFFINAQADGEVVELPEFLDYEYISDTELKSGSFFSKSGRTGALDHNAGLRFTSHLGSWDFSVMHFEGAAPQPKIKPTLVLDYNIARSPIYLEPVYYRTRTSGLGVVWARESYIVRMESAYQHTVSEDSSLQPWSWSNVAGVETNVEMGSTTATVLAQYYYTKNPQSADNMLSSSYRLFDRTGLLGVRWAYSDDLTVTASGLYETKTKGLFWMVAFEQKLSDSLKWGAGWRDFSAQDEGLIKTFERNDHANLEMIYYF